VVITSRSDGGVCRIEWKEIGGPVVGGAPGAAGFGSRLISLSVEGQLRGKVERLWEPDGLRVEVTLPLDALSRSGRLQTRQTGPR